MTTTTTAGRRTAGIAPCCLLDRHDKWWWLPDGGNRSLLLLRHDPPDGGNRGFCSLRDTHDRHTACPLSLLERTRYLPSRRGFESFYGYLSDEIDYFSHAYPSAFGETDDDMRYVRHRHRRRRCPDDAPRRAPHPCITTADRHTHPFSRHGGRVRDPRAPHPRLPPQQLKRQDWFATRSVTRRGCRVRKILTRLGRRLPTEGTTPISSSSTRPRRATTASSTSRTTRTRRCSTRAR